MKVLYAASEAYPFFTSGGLGDVAGSLPIALKKRKVDIRVVLPLYGDMAPEWRRKLKYVTNFTVPVGWRNQYCGLFELTKNGVVYYFLDNEYYFKRRGLYGFYDDGERFAFYSRAILEALFHIDFSPDILHCNDWETALVPVYLNLYYRHLEKYSGIKTVFTIHNIQYQGKYGLELLEETIGIGRKDAHIVEFDRDVNFMKGAVETADKVTTVSPTYAKEILDPWFSHGLDSFLRKKEYKLSGILNGIDIDVYNPEKDPNIAKNYSKEDVEAGKPLCKADLRKEFHLAETSAPILGMVSRMVNHKGFDLVRHVADNLVSEGLQLVILGSGEVEYEAFFQELAAKRAGEVGVRIGFIPELARKVYAGADMLLMPSKAEPCGLAQMVALRYGTVPIVRLTGGLRDTISDAGDGKGNGFTFASYNAYDMQNACLRAKESYERPEEWKGLIERDMRCDFSWGASARQYLEMYKEVVALW
ncbi:glycogen synthase GlgA [Ruminococcaceae bacterium OttesenSCG-928-I18]|nr:glycogen synthase GlgA [Ruminococcaceae bacterium OttesenSCG-928-I18]